MDTSLQRLGRKIERTTGMAGVPSRAGLVPMVEDLGRSLPRIGFGKIVDCVTKRHPRLPLRRKEAIEPSHRCPEAAWRPRRGS